MHECFNVISCYLIFDLGNPKKNQVLIISPPFKADILAAALYNASLGLFQPASPSTLGTLKYSVEPLNVVILRNPIIPLIASPVGVSKYVS